MGIPYKKFLRSLLLIAVILSLFTVIFTSCKGDKDKKEDDSNKNGNAETMDLPDWFLNVPTSQDVIYAAGYAKSRSMQLAIDTAATRARDEISRIIKVKVNNMTKSFLEEAGVDDQTQLTEYSSSVSKSIASNTISGTKIKERSIKSVGDKFVAIVLVELSLKDMTGIVEKIMNENASAYAKLQAEKGFTELTSEITNLKSDDYETPVKPEIE